MLSIALEYLRANDYNDGRAIEAFIADLMRDDPETFKAGYTRENAELAAADAFGLPLEEIQYGIRSESGADE